MSRSPSCSPQHMGQLLSPSFVSDNTDDDDNVTDNIENDLTTEASLFENNDLNRFLMGYNEYVKNGKLLVKYLMNKVIVYTLINQPTDDILKYECCCKKIVTSEVINGIRVFKGEYDGHECEYSSFRIEFFEMKKWTLCYGSEKEIEDFEKYSEVVVNDDGYVKVENRNWLFTNKNDEIIVRDPNNRETGKFYAKKENLDNKVLYQCTSCEGDKKANVYMMFTSINLPVLFESIHDEHTPNCAVSKLFAENDKKYQLSVDQLDIFSIIPENDWEFGYSSKGVKNNRIIIKDGKDKNFCYEYGSSFNKNSQRIRYTCLTCKYNSSRYYGYYMNNNRVIFPQLLHECQLRSYEEVMKKQKSYATIIKDKEVIRSLLPVSETRHSNRNFDSYNNDGGLESMNVVNQNKRVITNEPEAGPSSSKRSNNGSNTNIYNNTQQTIKTNSSNIEESRKAPIIKNDRIKLYNNKDVVLVEHENNANLIYRYFVDKNCQKRLREIPWIYNCINCPSKIFARLYSHSDGKIVFRSFFHHSCLPINVIKILSDRKLKLDNIQAIINPRGKSKNTNLVEDNQFQEQNENLCEEKAEKNNNIEEEQEFTNFEFTNSIDLMNEVNDNQNTYVNIHSATTTSPISASSILNTPRCTPRLNSELFLHHEYSNNSVINDDDVMVIKETKEDVSENNFIKSSKFHKWLQEACNYFDFLIRETTLKIWNKLEDIDYTKDEFPRIKKQRRCQSANSLISLLLNGLEVQKTVVQLQIAEYLHTNYKRLGTINKIDFSNLPLNEIVQICFPKNPRFEVLNLYVCAKVLKCTIVVYNYLNYEKSIVNYGDDVSIVIGLDELGFFLFLK